MEGTSGAHVHGETCQPVNAPCGALFSVFLRSVQMKALSHTFANPSDASAPSFFYFFVLRTETIRLNSGRTWDPTLQAIVTTRIEWTIHSVSIAGWSQETSTTLTRRQFPVRIMIVPVHFKQLIFVTLYSYVSPQQLHLHSRMARVDDFHERCPTPRRTRLHCQSRPVHHPHRPIQRPRRRI